jgi:glutathione S-transferase
VSATLFFMPGSASSMIARLMLDHKGIAYKEIALGNPAHRQLVTALGFPGFKVPSVSTDGRRLHGTLAIAKGLEEIQPEPPLFPEPPDLRALVEDIQRWVERTVEPIPARLAAALRVNGNAAHDLTEVQLRARRAAEGAARDDADDGSDGNVLTRVQGAIVSFYAPPLGWLRDRVIGGGDILTRTVGELSGALDRIDSLIGDGVLGGKQPNAADFHVAPRVRSLMGSVEVRRFMAGRPAVRHALSICPRWPD